MMSRGQTKRVAELLTWHSSLVIAAMLVVTALLVVPLLLMTPSQQASQNPGGPVFDLQGKVDRRLPRRLRTKSPAADARSAAGTQRRRRWAVRCIDGLGGCKLDQLIIESRVRLDVRESDDGVLIDLELRIVAGMPRRAGRFFDQTCW